eukprot:CAMPEP_0113896068 /NCGR_PEP_ID=MMETSP0780_2-20120614/17762_1 /TAXON_ID=652834 /ORGANISM="Palpitomonas bilix" /LENGTH=161 /DNA_ID=CAMNT_0000887067 /DNA_START=41 /DNA_END=529 /DNA_ORIENTATION=+ /assembly_acc=CAM_ASM_000599
MTDTADEIVEKEKIIERLEGEIKSQKALLAGYESLGQKHAEMSASLSNTCMELQEAVDAKKVLSDTIKTLQDEKGEFVKKIKAMMKEEEHLKSTIKKLEKQKKSTSSKSGKGFFSAMTSLVTGSGGDEEDESKVLFLENRVRLLEDQLKRSGIAVMEAPAQ